MSNCKVLAERVSNFQIPELEKIIRINLKKMEDFFYDSYKGFYCAICN